ncbi:MAG: CBS domain-containing protein [Gemmataceae bacterium]|nr:CBS domain-containing protein [Gemmataceae bacterium]
MPDAVLNEPVGRHARTDYATLYPDRTVGEALDHMRRFPPPGRIIYFYVVDDQLRLVGVVPTRRLLLSPTDTLVRDIMIREVIAVPADATVLEACEFFTLHRLLAFPVVESGRRLVGVVDVELYAEELAETGDEAPPGAARDDLFQLIGVRLTRTQQTRPLRAFRGRFPWLLCNVAGGTLAAILAGFYEAELNWNHAVLALFIPVVLALAESVAIQSVTLALDGLRASPPTWGELGRRLRYEGATGLLLGAATGLLVAGMAAVWQGVPVLFLIVAGGIGLGVTGAAVCGLAVPYILRLLERNPHLAAGPIALTCADVLTLLAYFNLAKLLTP